MKFSMRTVRIVFRPVSMIALVSLFYMGCSNSGSEQIESKDSLPNGNISEEQNSDLQLSKAKKIFYMLPSPIETASILKKAGASYDKDILNSINNLSKYETIKSKALNLGIYGTDLSYTSIFDQTHESMLYVSCTKRLADELGITKAFDENRINRIENNIDSKDSMLNIISESYWVADAFLKEGQRNSISGLIIAGGWIEGLYLSTRLINEENPNKELMQRIAEQKYSLFNLIALLETYPKNVSTDDVLSDLMKLKEIFNKLEVIETPSKSETDPHTGVTTIGATKEIIISKDQLSQIIQITDELRNKYIEP